MVSSAVDSTIELACTGLAHNAQGQMQISPLCTLASVEWAAAWPLVPRSGTLERPTRCGARVPSVRSF